MKIKLYGLCHSMSMSISYLLMKNLFLKKFMYINKDDFALICIGLIIMSYFGARLIQLIEGKFTWDKIYCINKGGLTSYGAWYLDLFYLYFVSWFYNENLFLIFECFIFIIPIMITFVRLGNYFNNELGGKYICNIPFQLIKSLTEGFIIFIIFCYMIKTIGEGYIYLIYSILYPSIRYINTFFEDENKIMPLWYRTYIYKYIRLSRLHPIIMMFLYLTVYYLHNKI